MSSESGGQESTAEGAALPASPPDALEDSEGVQRHDEDAAEGEDRNES